MKILGVDPGTIRMGYGVIEAEGTDVSMICCGTLSSPKGSTIGERLSYLYGELSQIVGLHSPDAVAVEQPFVAKNIKSTLTIGKAQAVALLAAANRGIATFEYTPTQVKQRLTNYGTSPKEQVQEMVRLQLGLAEAPQPNDAADALAVALCHLQEMKFKKLTAEAEK